MNDLIPKGTGNSRFLKSAISAATTWEQFRAMLIAGNAPIDLNGLNPEGIQQQGTPLSKETLLKDATAALYGLPGSAVPDEVLKELAQAKNSLVRDLNIMLNLSLGTSNIDAWADVLNDDTKLDAAKTFGCTVSGGALKRSEGFVSQLDSGVDLRVAHGTDRKVGQTFIPPASGVIKNITVRALKSGSPSNSLKIKIYTSDKATSIGESTNSFYIPDLPTTYTDITFNFNDIPVVAGTEYFFEVYGTAAPSSTNFARIAGASGNKYQSGAAFIFGTIWVEQADVDTYFNIRMLPEIGVARWNPTAATTPLSFAAIAAELNALSGTAAFFISDNGLAWTSIQQINTPQPVNFTSASVYVKAEIAGNAELNAIAWGGY